MLCVKLCRDVPRYPMLMEFFFYMHFLRLPSIIVLDESTVVLDPKLLGEVHKGDENTAKS